MRWPWRTKPLWALPIGALTGFVGGAACGAVVTLFNNEVLVPRGQAAQGSYVFWVPFFAWMFALTGLVIGGAVAFAASRKRKP